LVNRSSLMGIGRALRTRLAVDNAARFPPLMRELTKQAEHLFEPADSVVLTTSRHAPPIVLAAQHRRNTQQVKEPSRNATTA
jgi:hypothetical protein